MKTPRRWYRLSGLIVTCVAFVILAIYKAPAAAYVGLSTTALGFFGEYIAKHFTKS